MTSAASSPFSRSGALALVALGVVLFLALAYLIGKGEEFGGRGNDGAAHASATGLNGYAGLVRLIEAQDYVVTRSRNQTGFETGGLLVLTPPADTDPEVIANLLVRREDIGPTLVILPKWQATPPSRDLPLEVRTKFKRGWVMLQSANPVDWSEALPQPYRVEHRQDKAQRDTARQWQGLGLKGRMPTQVTQFAQPSDLHETLIADGAGRPLALKVIGEQDSDYRDNAHWTLVIADADLANNYGLSDRNRAAAIAALIDVATYDGEIGEVTFDLTLNGYGAAENLLTLAFRPPFLAATLCLLLALLIVGWRAFERFGPPAAPGAPDIALGKRQLIANGAGLILRARRFGLLARPYAALSARRIADRLGLARAEGDAIDVVLAHRLPGEEPYTNRAAQLEKARKPADILAAARALDELANKL